MIKPENLILIEDMDTRNNKLLDRVGEINSKESEAIIISYNKALVDQGKEGAVEFILNLEEQFTRRASGDKRNKLIIVLNNAEILFSIIPNHYKTLLVGYILTALTYERYNTEVVLASSTGKTLEEVFFLADS